ncbi:PadR family transcriptional regulator [Actinomycetes bacterium KLBMP 9797]
MKEDALAGQLRRGTLEYCVLAILRDGEQYALDVLRQLGAVEGLVTSEGTIYPLLSRLRRDGLVETTWHESPAGPPRRYHRLTPAGRQKLDDFVPQWIRFRDAIDTVIVPKEGT